uniref:Phage protein n=1 Tax=Panagrolaimus davidi TaxID=227884 RepID=A0A914Q838_9BILA
MKVICVDGREYEFAEAPPNGIQEIIARNALRVTAKGCNAKFNPFLASFENLDYLFCQFRTKYIRDRLAYEFFVEDVVLDVRGVTYEVINDFKASCGILRLYKAEDFIASISPVPE